MHALSESRVVKIKPLRSSFGWIAITVSAALCALATHTTVAQQPLTTQRGKPLAFSVVSIKRHGEDNSAGVAHAPDCHIIRITNMTFRYLISEAYNLKESRFLLGGPSWSNSDRYDLEAKLDDADIPATNLTYEQCNALLQPVLADRFQLKVHHETHAMPIFNLVIAKGGLKMKESTPSEPAATSAPVIAKPCSMDVSRSGTAVVHSCPMERIIGVLEDGPEHYLVDKTGLTGRYDFELHWTPNNTRPILPLLAALPSSQPYRSS